MADSQDFPITLKQVALPINDTHVEILLQGFSDKIFIIVTQYGKIGSLIHTTFDVLPSLARDPKAVPTTSSFLLGESSGPQADLYTLYATSITQAVGAMNPHEKRPVLLGIALKPLASMEEKRKVFHPILDAIMANPVW
ncbi:hypothetical protein DM01DRAFT_1313512 [Hesseltinella vesiculosa]|uniref:Uncharacterized protein n=1 Tax=Hesseltinella vesiculosa TaxID=101127 RepID=A0A1X2G293_9FUNG|nr:hypothetical protein DM01DRAFT_1313512 [Hesseltinella vesiculosa]